MNCSKCCAKLTGQRLDFHHHNELGKSVLKLFDEEMDSNQANITIGYRGVGSCDVTHVSTGESFTTDNPPEYGGSGLSFSATDLVAAGLGVCIATTIDQVAVRHGVPLEALSITVKKKLAQSPKRIERLLVVIHCQNPIDSRTVQRIENAAQHCGVKRSLHPDVKLEILFETNQP